MNDQSNSQTWVTANDASANPQANVINLQGAGNASAAGATGGQSANDRATQFNIPPQAQEKYPELIQLILTTESMTDDERQYWFQIMPVMTEEQLNKFKGILETEKKQLEKLDQEYEDQLKKLNDRHLIEWQEFESREKRREIQEQEKATEAEEKQAEEDLLQQLEDL